MLVAPHLWTNYSIHSDDLLLSFVLFSVLYFICNIHSAATVHLACKKAVYPQYLSISSLSSVVADGCWTSLACHFWGCRNSLSIGIIITKAKCWLPKRPGFHEWWNSEVAKFLLVVTDLTCFEYSTIFWWQSTVFDHRVYSQPKFSVAVYLHYIA